MAVGVGVKVGVGGIGVAVGVGVKVGVGGIGVAVAVAVAVGVGVGVKVGVGGIGVAVAVGSGVGVGAGLLHPSTTSNRAKGISRIKGFLGSAMMTPHREFYQKSQTD